MSTYSRQSQFELFPSRSSTNATTSKKKRAILSLSLSLDKVLIGSVGIVMVMVLSFSLGVEKGKKILLFTKEVIQDHGVRSQPTETEREGPRINVKVPQRDLEDEFTIEVKKAVPAIGALVFDKTDDNVYTIQVASFKKGKYAQQEADSLKKKGFESIVMPKGNYSIVCVGKFLKKKEAKIFSKKLKKRYKDCLVRRL